MQIKSMIQKLFPLLVRLKVYSFGLVVIKTGYLVRQETEIRGAENKISMSSIQDDDTWSDKIRELSTSIYSVSCRSRNSQRSVRSPFISVLLHVGMLCHIKRLKTFSRSPLLMTLLPLFYLVVISRFMFLLIPTHFHSRSDNGSVEVRRH